MWFKARKIQKTKESIAYHRGECEVLEAILHREHTSWERDRLVESKAKLRFYEERLKYLSESNANAEHFLEAVRGLQKYAPAFCCAFQFML
jgi:hypothetical protein